LDVLVVADDFRRNLSVKWCERRHGEDDARGALQVRDIRSRLYTTVSTPLADKANAEIHILRPRRRFFLSRPDGNLSHGEGRVDASSNELVASDRLSGVTLKECPLAVWLTESRKQFRQKDPANKPGNAF